MTASTEFEHMFRVSLLLLALWAGCSTTGSDGAQARVFLRTTSPIDVESALAKSRRDSGRICPRLAGSVISFLRLQISCD